MAKELSRLQSLSRRELSIISRADEARPRQAIIKGLDRVSSRRVEIALAGNDRGKAIIIDNEHHRSMKRRVALGGNGR